MNYTELSREISYALRHAPQEYDLQLDAEGWTGTGELIMALRKQERFLELTEADIADMIEASEKKRHELSGGRIRALYGHSLPDRIKKECTRPPGVLYHGTAHKFLDRILNQGLISKDRQYVHLSQDWLTALAVGKRRDDNPIVLGVDAAAAWTDGVKFYHGNEKIWLTDYIPAKYIRIESDKEY